jgi:hypothetical protein
MQAEQSCTTVAGDVPAERKTRAAQRAAPGTSRSGTDADLQERYAIRSAPERGWRGGRHQRHGQSAAAPVPSLLSPLGGGSRRQGVASVRARCRADGELERRLAAQWSAGGCADRRTLVTVCARAWPGRRGGRASAVYAMAQPWTMVAWALGPRHRTTLPPQCHAGWSVDTALLGKQREETGEGESSHASGMGAEPSCVRAVPRARRRKEKTR